jgi:transposase
VDYDSSSAVCLVGMLVGLPGKEAGMAKKYVVKLTAGERARLRSMVRSGRESARVLTRARVLLKCDEGWMDEEAADAVDTSLGTVERVRKRFCVGGLDAALADRPQPPRPEKRKIDGEAEAKLVTLACSTPPDGRESWTLELLADRMVRLNYVDGTVSGQTVRRVLKKTRSSRG